MKREIFHTDLSRCLPASRLANRHGRGRWKVIPYETAHASGRMLLAFDESDAGRVRLPLAARGRYDIFLGLFPTNANESGISGVRARLSGDPAFRDLLAPPGRGVAIYEAFWQQAEVTGRAIEFLPVGRRQRGDVISAVAWVRLARAGIAQEPPAPLWLGGFIDGESFLYRNRARTADDIRAVLEPLRDTPFRKVYWGFAVGDQRYYQSRGGTHPQTAATLTGGYRNVVEANRLFHQKRMDVLRVARDHARRMGIEFHLYHRPGVISAEPPFEELFGSPFVRAHTELALRDRDGTRLSQLSYAFPAVQDRMLSLFRDHLGYDPDGLNLCFHRGVPMVLFEGPGAALRRLGDDHPKLFAWRAGIITEYLRRVRGLLDSDGHRRELTATVLMTRAANRRYGLDVERWAREGIVDVLIPYAESRGLPDEGGMELEWFARVTKETRCRLAPELMDVRSWTSPEAHYVERARAIYRAGVDGICFWDIDFRCDKPLDRAIIQALARPRSLKQAVRRALRQQRHVALKTLGGVPMDRYPTWWAL